MGVVLDQGHHELDLLAAANEPGTVDVVETTSATPEVVAPSASAAPHAPRVLLGDDLSRLRPHRRDIGSTIRLILVVGLLAATLVLTVRGRPANGAASVGAGDFGVIAADVTSAAAHLDGVRGATSGYVDGVGIVVDLELASIGAGEVTGWLAELLAPFAERIAALPHGQGVVVTITVVADPTMNRMVRISRDAVTDVGAWTQIVPTAGASTGDTSGPQATSSTGSTEPSTTLAASVISSATDPATTDGVNTSSPSESTVGTADPGTEDFSGDDAHWTARAGTWAVANGVYSQSDSSGYDYISSFDTVPTVPFTLEVKLRAVGGPLNAGVVLGLTSPSKRDGATMIDLTADGTYVRWGTYGSPGGAYQFVGGAAVTLSGAATEWHALKVTVTDTGFTVELDGATVGSGPAPVAGAIGLVTSVASVDFDDVRLSSP